MSREDKIVGGVAEAWVHCLERHDVTVPELLFVVIEKAVRDWLDAHEAAIIAAITAKNGPRTGRRGGRPSPDDSPDPDFPDLNPSDIDFAALFGPLDWPAGGGSS